MKGINSRSLIILAGAMASSIASICSTSAQESQGLREMRMAEQHASAAKASDLEQVKAHLQQALNCLAGKGESEYRSSAGDPCRGASTFRDLPGNTLNKIRIRKAIRLASVGVTLHDFKPTH